MIDQSTEVLTRLKRMDDARLRATSPSLPKIGGQSRRKLSLSFDAAPSVATPAASGIDSKSFRGSYLLYRKAGKAMESVKRCRGGVAPRFRHPDRASAEREAARLLGIFPNSIFIVLQEVGRVKVKAND